MECVKCGREIGKKEHYIQMKEFETGKLSREEFWHIICFKNREKDSMKNLALGLAARAGKLMEKAEVHLN